MSEFTFLLALPPSLRAPLPWGAGSRKQVAASPTSSLRRRLARFRIGRMPAKLPPTRLFLPRCALLGVPGATLQTRGLPFARASWLQPQFIPHALTVTIASAGWDGSWGGKCLPGMPCLTFSILGGEGGQTDRASLQPLQDAQGAASARRSTPIGTSEERGQKFGLSR